ncbi:MAG: hypothetical protein WBG91_09990, partial [Syntrophobacteria bacterium]
FCICFVLRVSYFEFECEALLCVFLCIPPRCGSLYGLGLEQKKYPLVEPFIPAWRTVSMGLFGIAYFSNSLAFFLLWE